MDVQRLFSCFPVCRGRRLTKMGMARVSVGSSFAFAAHGTLAAAAP